MNCFFKLVSDLHEMMERTDIITDKILDLYKKHPKKCKELLLEVNDINKELKDLEEEYKKIQNEIY